LLPDNIVAYRDNGSEAQQSLAGIIGELNSTVAGLIDLAQQCQVPRERRLLRYPLLVDASFRDRLYNQLRRFGLGPSVMYPAALPGILGLQSFLSDQGPFPAAEAFAARILTLPTHRRVGSEDMANIRRILCSG
jgi:dTDP-4-amino-4,6-dideoxygalactose transaminase